ncbi:MAG: glycosyltransferase [Candidatus Saganbacteria bacterium]|nr:glycosyltransferase [Candidatus Saganbacteria bacterium]
MRVLIDLFLINISAVAALLLREKYGHFIREAPSYYSFKYFWVLICLDVLYLFLFWLLGAYDKRNKRALLEDFVLVFGVICTGLFILITFLFMGQMWWMSRGILYMFGFLSISFLCFFRVFVKSSQNVKQVAGYVYDMDLLKKRLLEGKGELGSLRGTLSVIIVGYNSQKTLGKCLSSLEETQKTLPFEVVFIDNNSSDGSAEVIRRQFPWVRLIVNAKNVGYTKAVNQGLKMSQTEYSLILNPDIIVFPGSIELMIDYMRKNPKIGIVGCKLLNEDGSLQHSVRRFLDLRTYLYRFTPIRGLMAGSALERFYLMQDWDHKDNRLVDWVLGGCMLVKKEAVDQVGMMDEKIFLYFDDVDWCYRMWGKGWQVAYVAEAAMLHKHMRASANNVLSRATREHFKSLFYFIFKHGFGLPQNCPSSLE